RALCRIFPVRTAPQALNYARARRDKEPAPVAQQAHYRIVSSRHSCATEAPQPRGQLLREDFYCGLAAAAPAGCAPGAPPASAAFGSGAGLSESVLRYVITSARSLPRWIPAKVMLVPGMYPRGLIMN